MKKVVALMSILVGELYGMTILGYMYGTYHTDIFLWLIVVGAIITIISSILSVYMLKDKKMDHSNQHCPYYIDKEISKDE